MRTSSSRSARPRATWSSPRRASTSQACARRCGGTTRSRARRWLEQLIRALALAGGDTKLVVAGRGPQARLARLALALRVDTIFHGEVEDVRPLLAAADVFALPTFYDTCSLATLEAIAAGL